MNGAVNREFHAATDSVRFPLRLSAKDSASSAVKKRKFNAKGAEPFAEGRGG